MRNQEKRPFETEAPIITKITFDDTLSVPNAAGDTKRPSSPNKLAKIFGVDNTSDAPSTALNQLPSCEEPPLPLKIEATSLTDNKVCPAVFSASMTKFDTSLFSTDLAFDDEFEDLVATSMLNLIGRGRSDEEGATLSLNSKTGMVSLFNAVSNILCLLLLIVTIILCRKDAVQYPKEKYVKAGMPAIDKVADRNASSPISPQSQEPSKCFYC